MHSLIVVAHPEQGSLTHTIVEKLVDSIRANQHSAEVADLAAEGFDPRYTLADLALMRNRGPVPDEIASEHARINRADALVLVYPVYWWSFPALLKGWIDRVFTLHWAYDEAEGGLLQRLPVHLVGIGGSSLRTYDKHGYATAMKVQIEHGIFGYCGAPVVSSTLLSLAETGDVQTHLDAASRIGKSLFQ